MLTYLTILFICKKLGIKIKTPLALRKLHPRRLLRPTPPIVPVLATR
ncbi:MAG: hypothetical protein HC913_01360 [Microscillaceae bacterium]|nr:hypothetical protein [Microscillaceae bacterium]